jgi:hypothetical protein
MFPICCLQKIFIVIGSRGRLHQCKKFLLHCCHNIPTPVSPAECQVIVWLSVLTVSNKRRAAYLLVTYSSWTCWTSTRPIVELHRRPELNGWIAYYQTFDPDTSAFDILVKKGV